jgi:hypothetical protein
MATQSDFVSASSDALASLVYTVISDTCNEMIAAGLDQAKVLECANSITKKYVENSIKMRKRPASRATKPTKPTKDISVSRTKNKETPVWVTHPANTEYQYTTSIKLTNGYPVRTDNMIVGVIDDNTCRPLTADDARIAISHGLVVDFDNIVDTKPRTSF